jgi:hypothetical protein
MRKWLSSAKPSSKIAAKESRQTAATDFTDETRTTPFTSLTAACVDVLAGFPFAFGVTLDVARGSLWRKPATISDTEEADN